LIEEEGCWIRCSKHRYKDTDMGRGKPLRSQALLSALGTAKALWANHRYDEALRKFYEAVRIAPDDAATLIEASRAMAQRYQIDRSCALLEKAARLAPRRPDILHAIAESYLRMGRHNRAERHFRRACLVGPLPHSQLELAKLCERQHLLDEAEELVERVLRRQPGMPAAMLLRARLERRHGYFEAARATLRQLIAAAGERPPWLPEAYGELCVLLDAMGEYDAAWDAILLGKRILLARDGAAWDAAQHALARSQRMLEALTPDQIRRWQHSSVNWPQARAALLTGFPRSGTTLLEQMLDAHPQVISSEEKEVFGAEVLPMLSEGRADDFPLAVLLDELTDVQLGKARQTYLQAMEAMLGEPIGPRLHIDKNPAMIPIVPAMRRVFPELKLIIALRDPRDVIVSCFLRYLPLNPVSVCFLTLERSANRYVLDMGAWLKMREMIGDWVEVRYEQMVANMQGEAERVLGSLELPRDGAVMQYRAKVERKAIASPSYVEIARPVFTTSIGRWHNYEHQLAPVLDKLAPLVNALGYES
jgi:tetratricopeptide (TPR) repeat protein